MAPLGSCSLFIRLAASDNANDRCIVGCPPHRGNHHPILCVISVDRLPLQSVWSWAQLSSPPEQGLHLELKVMKCSHQHQSPPELCLWASLSIFLNSPSKVESPSPLYTGVGGGVFYSSDLILSSWWNTGAQASRATWLESALERNLPHIHPTASLLECILKVKVAKSCPTLCDPTDYTVHGILQARILEWVAFPFSRGSSQPRDQTQVSHIAGGFLTSWATREAPGREWILEGGIFMLGMSGPCFILSLPLEKPQTYKTAASIAMYLLPTFTNS